MKKKIIIFTLLVIILIVIAFILKKPPERTEGSPPETRVEESDYLRMEIVTPNEFYGVGEEFYGEYLFEYKGDPFQGILLYSKWMKGYEEKAVHEKISGTIRSGDLNRSLSLFKRDLRAFHITGDIIKEDERHFSDPGEYIYAVSLFDCSKMGLSEKGCLARLPTRFLLSFDPVKRVSKTITVEGGVDYTQKNVFECGDNKSCHLQIIGLFEDRLASCTPSKGTFVIPFEKEIFGVSRNYRIMGKDKGECVVIFSYITEEEVPFTFILEKEMTCRYIEKETNIEFVSLMEKCEGPLYDEMETFFESTDG